MKTKVSEAAALAAEHIKRAGSPAASSAERCIAYLEAAEAAIDGLETEYDELLIEAKFCDLTDPTDREELDKRIERYLHLDILRPQLQKATTGLKTSLNEIRQAYEPKVGQRMAAVLETLTGYLDDLDQSGLSCRPARTGVAVQPLTEIQGDLRKEKLFTTEGRKLLRNKAETFQRASGKDGLLLRTDEIRQTIESLRLALAHPSDKIMLNEQTPLIFISHCHADEGITRGLIDLLEAAISLSPNEIRATSVPGYKLRAGSRVADELQREIAKVRVVLCVVTKRVSESPYVLFELGAAWGLGKPICPLIAPGIDPAQILGPIASVHRIDLKNIPDCHQLVDDVCRAISRNAIGSATRIADKVQRLVQQVSGAQE
jgi:hypothetical protein